jgi:glycosyltransferase involved in cell wall biosynthesis
MSKLARECGANIIHAHLLGASVYGALIGLLQGLPVIAVFHGETDLRGPSSFLAAKRWLLNRAHVTPVAVSDSVRHGLEDWGVLCHKIRIIQNGVDTVRFAPGGGGSLHASLGLAPNSRIIGAVGNIRPAKSYNVLVETARHIVLGRPDVHFVLAGSGNERDVDELRRLVEQAGIAANFHFIGFCPSSSELYRSFAMLASSATTEGLPLSFLEAMACEVPIVATANKGAEGLVNETGAGLLSPVGDAKALAAAIQRLLDDPVSAALLARRGRAAVTQHFSLERSLTEYHALYRRVLSKD